MASETIETVGDKNVEKRGAGQFVADVREEMTRVSFPSRDDVRNTTVIVIVNVIFFAVFLFLVDQGWTYALQGLEWLVNQIAALF